MRYTRAECLSKIEKGRAGGDNPDFRAVKNEGRRAGPEADEGTEGREGEKRGATSQGRTDPVGRGGRRATACASPSKALLSRRRRA
jgi:hypothetical protein